MLVYAGWGLAGLWRWTLFPRKRLGASESSELARNMALLSAAFSSGVGEAPPKFRFRVWMQVMGSPFRTRQTFRFAFGHWMLMVLPNGRPECAPVSHKVCGGNPSGEWTGGTQAPLGSMAVAWRRQQGARKQGCECVQHDPSSVSPSVGPRFGGHTAGWGCRVRCVQTSPKRKHNESVAEDSSSGLAVYAPSGRDIGL